MIDAGAALAAWLGASLVVLADGRRGLAAGVAIAAAGVAVIALQGGDAGAAAAILAGGGIAAARRWTLGPDAWRIMPAGSTPRLVLCVAGGLVSLWIALSVTSGGSAGLRFGVLTVVGLGAARALSSDEPAVVLTAAALVSLALGAAAALGADSAVWAGIGAGVVAAGAGWLPLSARRAA